MKRIFSSTFWGSAALFSAGALLAGCSGLQGTAAAPGAALDASVAISSLAGTRWQVTRVADQPVPAAINPTVQFDDRGQVFGSAGCNQFSGAYQLENGGLRVERLATTRKLCFPALMYQEEALLRVLRGAERVYLQDDALILESARERGRSRMIPLPEAPVPRS
ncbi:META domain-containing protein [Marinobacterium rhizophilum]|uniref:META domain-containing protein n=1 Tax=Marinobacterium rhizophilum TaxID=420402 RepID=A0ABY5HPK3_9GAMM|nr:META domain-containing protein [Marinobacterium rhizophilum]UTW13717.1 META domain-containing protein [Marinobacterium rhizophilum]